MPPYSLAEIPVLAFVAIPVLLAVAFVWGVAAAGSRAGASRGAARKAACWSAAGAALWMGLTWSAAAAGLVSWQGQPPRFAFVILGTFALAGWISFGRVGARLAMLPLWVLVAVQSFRLPLELAMHAMYERGIMPAVMSYSGRNFDIVTGIAAMAVAALVAAGRGGPRLVAAWNVLGLALLFNVIGVAILATPPIRFFGDDQLNVWVTYAPFVWLPSVMVLAALAGHLIIFRALRRS